MTADVPAAQTVQKPSRSRRQERAQTYGEPLPDDAAVHQLLISQHRHSDLSNHIQNLQR